MFQKWRTPLQRCRTSTRPLARIGVRVTFAAASAEVGANGSVVQLVRMPPCHGGGRGFESRPDRNGIAASL